jgi:thioredoxin-like negative regulator of GroEL
MLMFKDGHIVDEFLGSREISRLVEFIGRHQAGGEEGAAHGDVEHKFQEPLNAI